MNTRFTPVKSNNTNASTTKRIVAVLISVLVASCGGGDDGDNVAIFNVKSFFEQFRDGGATYTLEGTFTDSSGSTDQRHELMRTPIQIFAGDWQGMTNLRQSKVRVDRFVDGATGAVDEYILYFDSAGVQLGFQARGQDGYQILDGADNIPAAASIGDTGTRKRMSIHDMEGGPITGYQIVTWELKESFDAVPSYCETETQYSLADVVEQVYEWCYGLQTNGDPTGDISFGYRVSDTNFGLIQGDNMTPNGPIDVGF